MSGQQCSRCDDVADLVESAAVSTLEEVAQVINAPAPSLHVHLVQHDRDDLLRRLTYAGVPILAPAAEPAVEHEVAEEPGTFEVEVDDEPAKDPGVQTRTPAIDGGVDERGDGSWPEQPVWHLAEPSVDQAAMTPVLQNLIDHHPSEDVRCAAESLLAALSEWEQDRKMRSALERLVAQRDQLNAAIEELAARLGDIEPAPPEPAPLRRSEKPVRNLSAQDLGVADDGPPAKAIRAWCRDNGVPCPATGRVPRSAVEAWREAHGVA